MLTLTFPYIFGAAVAASLVVTLLHFLSVRTPPALVLPTARFVPGGNARAVARQPRLNDVPLLLLRVLALCCAGAALAGVRWHASQATRLRLVIADETQLRDRVWRDSVTRVLTRADALVEVHGARGVADDPGAALVAATQHAARAAARVPALTDVELTVLLPPTAVSTAGYVAWRAQWPGDVQVVTRTARAEPDTTAMVASPVLVRGGAADDAVAAAVRFHMPTTSRGALRIERALGPDDVRRGAAALVVDWPVSGVPAGWVAREREDSAGALTAAGSVLVGPFLRRAVPGGALAARLDSGARATQPVRVLAWWSDGAPAALEEGVAPACRRSVAVVVPRGSDLLLSPDARGLLNALWAPCGGVRVATASAVRGDVARETAPAPALAPAAAFRSSAARQHTGSDPWWLAPALLAVALLALAVEWRLRDREPAS